MFQGKSVIAKKIEEMNITVKKMHAYQVCAFGKLSVLVSTKWIVKSLGPAAPVEPTNTK